MEAQLHTLQFAVGGRELPPPALWIKVAERLRGRAVRKMCELLTSDSEKTFASLTLDERDALRLISGKDRAGRALVGHHHSYFLVWPDEHGYPTRLVVWRRVAPFARMEVEAILFASGGPISWGNQDQLYLVPLPLEMPPPLGFAVTARVWRSVTPFVPPAVRHRFRANGRPRPGETAERLARNLLVEGGVLPPARITRDAGREQVWMRLHETRQRRLLKGKARSSFVRPGFYLRLEFDAPVQGPIIIGDSCHYGLGLFRGLEDSRA